jgi:hypothetical protein
VRGKKFSDEVEKYIASARKHDFFGAKVSRFYDDLDELRRLRNRIHIQNSKGDFEPNEYNAFTERRKVQAEEILEQAVKWMASQYGRGVSYRYVRNFSFPWIELCDRMRCGLFTAKTELTANMVVSGSEGLHSSFAS